MCLLFLANQGGATALSFGITLLFRSFSKNKAAVLWANEGAIMEGQAELHGSSGKSSVDTEGH